MLKYPNMNNWTIVVIGIFNLISQEFYQFYVVATLYDVNRTKMYDY